MALAEQLGMCSLRQMSLVFNNNNNNNSGVLKRPFFQIKQPHARTFHTKIK